MNPLDRSLQPEPTPANRRWRPAVSVIVVTYNSARTIELCLQSLKSQSLRPHEVIVVDNCSLDLTRETLSVNTDIELVKSSSNLGFPGACNLGAQLATGQFLAFLNPDASLADDSLETLIKFLEDHPAIAAASCKIYWSNLVTPSRARVNADGNEANYLLFGWARRCGLDDLAESNPFPVLYPSGAAMVVRKQAFEDVGGFDPDLFLYHDDLDLGIRLRLRGWDIMSVPSAAAFHDYEFLRHPMKFFYLERNRLMVLAKIYLGRTLLRLLPAFLVGELATAIFALSRGWFGYKIASYIEVVRRLPSILTKRKVIARTRLEKDARILSYCCGGIYYPFLTASSWLSRLNRLLEKYREAFLSGKSQGAEGRESVS